MPVLPEPPVPALSAVTLEACRSDLARLTLLVTTQQNLVMVLWLFTGLAGVGLAVWVLVAGPLSGVAVRAGAIARLWPLLAVWTTGLWLYGRSGASQVRELVQADALVGLAEQTAARRATARGAPV